MPYLMHPPHLSLRFGKGADLARCGVVLLSCSKGYVERRLVYLPKAYSVMEWKTIHEPNYNFDSLVHRETIPTEEVQIFARQELRSATVQPTRSFELPMAQRLAAIKSRYCFGPSLLNPNRRICFAHL